jgi:hypothetical protein
LIFIPIIAFIHVSSSGGLSLSFWVVYGQVVCGEQIENMPLKNNTSKERILNFFFKKKKKNARPRGLKPWRITTEVWHRLAGTCTSKPRRLNLKIIQP